MMLTSGPVGACTLAPCTGCPSSWDIGGGEWIGASLRTSLCAPYVEDDSWRLRASNLTAITAITPKAIIPTCTEVNSDSVHIKNLHLPPTTPPIMAPVLDDFEPEFELSLPFGRHVVS
jgi:hypothetical protein